MCLYNGNDNNNTRVLLTLNECSSKFRLWHQLYWHQLGMFSHNKVTPCLRQKERQLALQLKSMWRQTFIIISHLSALQSSHFSLERILMVINVENWIHFSTRKKNPPKLHGYLTNATCDFVLCFRSLLFASGTNHLVPICEMDNNRVFSFQLIIHAWF